MATSNLKTPVVEWKGVTPGLTILVGALLAALFFIDRVLARTEQIELRHQAVGLAAEGARSMSQGKPADALDSLQRAHALFRDDRDYALAYAEALLQAGQVERAETALREVLEKNSNDGRANLLMARAMIAGGEATGATSYYHRAIYGSWGTDAFAKRNQVRLELADRLAKMHSKDELLAELLPLEASSAENLPMKRRVAALFLAADAPARAADEYHSMLAANPRDSAAYAGLGEAELNMGNDHAAERAFESAGQKEKLAMVRGVIALDPTPRRLPSIQKYLRSLQLVDLSTAALKACNAARSSTEGEDLLRVADEVKQEKLRGSPSNELSEKRLDLAESLWRSRLKGCPDTVDANDPVTIVLNRLVSGDTPERPRTLQ